MTREKSEEHISSEFLERKKLIEMQEVIDKERHKLKMEELSFLRENEAMNHSHTLERNRIKSAEIRKADQRRADRMFMEKYLRGQ